MMHTTIAPIGYNIGTANGVIVIGYGIDLASLPSVSTVEKNYVYFDNTSGLGAGSYVFGQAPLASFGPFTNVPTINFQNNTNRKFYITNLTKDGFTINDAMEGSDALSVTVIVLHEFENES